MTTRSENDWNERNRSVIEQFRTNKGNVGDSFPVRPLLLLSTTGAKSGQLRTNPLVYLLVEDWPDGDRWIIIASKGGAPGHPDWYFNLVANPTVTVEVGPDTYQADATVVTGEERDTLFARVVLEHSFFADYERQTARKIPVVALTRKS